MTDFHVVPGSVAGLGGLVTRAGQAAGTFATALHDNATSSDGDGVYQLIEEPMARLRAAGQRNTGLARDLGIASGAELVKTAAFYGNVDRKEAGRLDRTYNPESSDRHDEWNLPTAIATKSFADIADPDGDGCYAAKDYAGLFEKALRRDQWAVDFEKQLNDLSDKTSFAGTVGNLMKKICGRNLLEEVTMLISGDWMQLYRESVVFADASKAFVVIRKNVDRGRFAIQDDWEGNAASYAENWLDAYSRSCTAHADFLEDAAREMERLSMAVYHRFKSLNILIGTVIDALAEWASAASVLSGIGKFASRAIKGEIGSEDWDRLKEYAAMVTGIVSVIDLFWVFAHEYAALLAVLAGQSEVTAATWPTLAYDHPAVS